MKIKNIILTCLATCLSAVAMAQDYSLSLQATTDKEDNSKATLDVFMTNKETVSAIQFDIVMSENSDVFYGLNADGDMAYLISKGDRAKTSHAVSFKKLEDRTYRVIVSSPKNDTFKETEANKEKPVVSIVVDMSNLKIGTSATVGIENTVLSHYDTGDGSVKMFYPENVTFDVSREKEAMKGDVNGDGIVNIDDVSAVINVICGGSEHADTADVTGEGTINIDDVSAVINIICGGK